MPFIFLFMRKSITIRIKKAETSIFLREKFRVFFLCFILIIIEEKYQNTDMLFRFWISIFS